MTRSNEAGGVVYLALVEFQCFYHVQILSNQRVILIALPRHGSHALDSSAATARSSPVMLSAAKHLAAARDRPFAEFTLSEAHGLRACP